MSITAAYVMPHPPIILPEVGRGEEKKLQKTTNALQICAKEIAAAQPETIVIVSPHAPMYSDYFHISSGSRAVGDFSRFHAPSVRFDLPYDASYTSRLSAIAETEDFPAGTLGVDGPLDHGTMIPLYFINQLYTGYKLVRIGFSGLAPITHYRFGELIAQAAKELDRSTVFIASGDLSHKLKEDGPYGFAKEGPLFDKRVTDALATGDFDSFLGYAPAFCEDAAECGMRSLQILAGVVGEWPATSELLSYEGPFGVGYAVAKMQF